MTIQQFGISETTALTWAALGVTWLGVLLMVWAIDRWRHID